MLREGRACIFLVARFPGEPGRFPCMMRVCTYTWWNNDTCGSEPHTSLLGSDLLPLCVSSTIRFYCRDWKSAEGRGSALPGHHLYSCVNWESSMADAVRECRLLVSLLPPGHQVSPAQCWLNGHHCGGVGSSTPWPCLRRTLAWWLWEHQGSRMKQMTSMWAFAFYYSYFSSPSPLLALASSSLSEI